MKRKLTEVYLAVMLPYVNLLMMVFVGTDLATASWLSWDPTLYFLRMLAPLECQVLSVVMVAAATALLLLAFLLQVGLTAKKMRRFILITYSGLMMVLIASEALAAAWLYWRIYEMLNNDDQVFKKVWSTTNNSLKLLNVYSLFEKKLDDVSVHQFDQLYYLAGGCLLLSVILQSLAVLLALLASRTRTPLQETDFKERFTNDNKTLLLTCMRPISSTPRCLRPLSGTEYTPASGLKENKSSRRSTRSKGWQLQPEIGWKQGHD